MTIQMNNFSDLAQQVWVTSTLEGKKAILLQMIDQFKFKAKVDQFKRKVQSITRTSQCDKMASDLALNDTDKVIYV